MESSREKHQIIERLCVPLAIEGNNWSLNLAKREREREIKLQAMHTHQRKQLQLATYRLQKWEYQLQKGVRVIT